MAREVGRNNPLGQEVWAGKSSRARGVDKSSPVGHEGWVREQSSRARGVSKGTIL
jgi:hypothetical protein